MDQTCFPGQVGRFGLASLALALAQLGSAWLRFWVPWWDPVLSDYPRLSQQRKLIASVVVAGFDRVKIAEPGQASTLRLL